MNTWVAPQKFKSFILYSKYVLLHLSMYQTCQIQNYKYYGNYSKQNFVYMINHEMRICLGIHFAFYMQTLHLIKLKSAAAFRTFISLSTVHSNIIAILWNWKKNWTNLSFTSCTIKRNSLKRNLKFSL